MKLEWKATQWKEEEPGIITFSLEPEVLSGSEWERDLFDSGSCQNFSPDALIMLNHADFKSTPEPVNVTVMKGRIFHDLSRFERPSIGVLRAEARRRGLRDPNPDLACLMRQAFPNSEVRKMGLRWLVAAHKPIIVHGGERLLGSYCMNDYPCVSAFVGEHSYGFLGGDGFAFIG